MEIEREWGAMKKLKNIRTGLVARNLSLLKEVSGLGKEYLFSQGDNLREKIDHALGERGLNLVDNLGEYKGGIVKAGQMLAHLSEYFFSPQVTEVLSRFQNQTSFLDWEKVKKQIPSHVLENLKMEPLPLAAASIGQVHRGIVKETGEEIVLKIQYPGIRDSVDTDLFMLRNFLKVLGAFPHGIDPNPLFEEIKKMLIQEMDYKVEAKLLNEYRGHLKGDDRFYVPKIFPEYSSETVLCMEYLEGFKPSSEYLKSCSVPEREQLADAYFDLFLQEIFSWGLVQSDPHPGNYLLRRNKDQLQWVLLDFGATKKISLNFKDQYLTLLKSILDDNRINFKDTVIEMGYFKNLSEEQEEMIWDYLSHVLAPLHSERYHWGESQIPDYVLKNGPRMMRKVSIGNPPQDSVFIDRKVGGAYLMLKSLNVETESGPKFERISQNSGK